MSDVRHPHELFVARPLDPPETGLRLIGELDLGTVRQLEDALETVSGPAPVTLDLSELTFIDSTGLHAIVQYARSGNGRGPVVLAKPSEIVRRIFEIADLDDHPVLHLRD